MIAIIDYGAGNLFNIYNAVEKKGGHPLITNKIEEIEKSSGIVLPGVGYAKTAMEYMKNNNIIPVLEHKVMEEKVPFLGICLGMQLIFEHSAEGDVDCLGWIKGNVCKISGARKVPQIGWNDIKLERKISILEGIDSGDDFYFIHSYCVKDCEKDTIVATTEYGETFVSIVQKNNIIGTQFHPEKSGEVGMKMISNFCEFVSEYK